MRFRKLRIAWSVVCGLAAVLLIVLWVRSFIWLDKFYYPLAIPKGILIQSWDGEIWCGRATFLRLTFNDRWEIDGIRINRATSSPDLRPFRTEEYRGVLRFGYVYYEYYQGAGASHAWVVVASVIAAVLPWIRWPKRFTLRTLLIATTLVALLLGGIVYAVR